jgi:hypothetical protein
MVTLCYRRISYHAPLLSPSLCPLIPRFRHQLTRMPNHISHRYIPVLFATITSTLGGIVTTFHSRHTMLSYGLPMHITGVPITWPVWMIGQCHTTLTWSWASAWATSLLTIVFDYLESRGGIQCCPTAHRDRSFWHLEFVWDGFAR